MKTDDLNDERLAKLKELYPDLFDGEGNLVKEELEKLADPEKAHPERFEFSWFGKAQAKRNAFSPADGALVYEDSRSVNPELADGNLIIEGENLEALKLLLCSYREKIKCIYIDPPYNKDADTVYKDDFSESRKEYWERTGITENGVKIDTNTRADGRYHSNWLDMMFPRLLLARQLLREDGVIFVSIDDNEVHHLRMMMNEVFGEENFVATLIWNKQHSQQQGLFKKYHEYVVLYAKSNFEQENITGGDGFIDAGALKKVSRGNPKSSFTFPPGIRFNAPDNFILEGEYGGSERVEVEKGRLVAKDGKTAEEVTLAAGWTQKEQMKKYFAGEEVFDSKGQKVVEFYFSSTGKLKCIKERSKITPPTILPLYGMVSEQTGKLTELMGANVFDNPKPVDMIKDFSKWFLDDDDIVLDFFAGSGPTAQAIIELNAQDGGNRKFILIQLPEAPDETTESGREAIKQGYKKISDITIERNKRVIERMAKEKAEKPELFEGVANEPGFKVYTLAKSHFPRVDFAPDPQKTDAEKIEALKAYIAEKEAAMHTLFNQDEILDEVLLKNGFMLDYTKERLAEVTANEVYLIADKNKEAFICLDGELEDETVNYFKDHKDRIFICLERALDTTKKWNLSHFMGEKFVAF